MNVNHGKTRMHNFFHLLGIFSLMFWIVQSFKAFRKKDFENSSISSFFKIWVCFVAGAIGYRALCYCNSSTACRRDCNVIICKKHKSSLILSTCYKKCILVIILQVPPHHAKWQYWIRQKIWHQPPIIAVQKPMKGTHLFLSTGDRPHHYTTLRQK